MKLTAILSILSVLIWPNLSFGQYTFNGKLRPNTFGIHRAVFLFRDSDLQNKDSLTILLNKNWKLTKKIELVSYEEYKPLAGDVTFQLGFTFSQTFSQPTYSYGGSTNSVGLGQQVSTGGVASNFVDFRLDLRYYQTETFSDVIASAKLFLGTSTAVDICLKHLSIDTVIRHAYKNSDISNWDYAYLSSFTGMCSGFLQTKQVFSPQAPKTSIAELKTDTLYISDVVNVKFRWPTGKRVRINRTKRVKSKYGLNCQIVSPEELNKLALEKDEGFVMYYIYVMHGRYIVVLDLKTNTVVYEMMGKRHRFNFKVSDISKLKRAILEPKQ